MPIEEAQRSGAMMLFGEKYGDEVRVLTIGSSKELCGGVHVQRSGDIGLFKIVAETGVAAGVRRVEAVTGETALALVQQQQAMLAEAAAAFKAPVAEVPAKLAQVLDNVRTLEKELPASKPDWRRRRATSCWRRRSKSRAPRCSRRSWKAPTSTPCARRSTSCATS
jgi:alanyl-tRNA synthetase